VVVPEPGFQCEFLWAAWHRHSHWKPGSGTLPLKESLQARFPQREKGFRRL